MIIKNRFVLKSTLLISIMLMATSLFALSPDLHVKWSFSANKINDCEYDLLLKAQIDKGYHLYSQIETPDGPLPTLFIFDKSDKYELIGTTIEPKPIEKAEPVFDNQVVRYFETTVTFKQRIKVKSSSNFSITGAIDGMVCNEGGCVRFFPSPTFLIQISEANCTGTFPATGAIGTTGAIVETSIPKVSDSANPNNGDFDFKTEIEKAVSNALAKGNSHPIVDTVGCKQKLIKPSAAELSQVQEDKSIWIIFILGFGGGLIALLTPCVFPMIPLTVSFFTKGNKSRKAELRNAFLYALSIVVIYVTLGMLITIVFGSDALNAMASSAVFNLIFFFVFIIFAFSFLGAFEITLPSRFVNKVDSASDRGGLLGIFFMAFTLCLVSFSCTGPIIGTLLVEAARDGAYFGPAVGMLGFALALALPFALFAMFPAWLKTLPKSGGWLNSVKVTLGFVEIALALKFLSTVDLAYHWDFLKRELFLAIWIVTAILLGMYLLGKLKLSHDSDVKYVSTSRVILALLSFTFAAYLIPGMWGAPTTFVSGYLPPAYYREWKDPKSSECPQDLSCFHDLQEGLCYAKSQGKPVLIDFTGFSCVNCRKMEDNVWSNSTVYKYLSENYVVISLYVDDKRELPDADKQYTNSEGEESLIKTYGNKWSSVEIDYYSQNSQPLYVLVDNDGKLIIPPKGYTPVAVEYADYLQEGLKVYNSRKAEKK